MFLKKRWSLRHDWASFRTSSLSHFEASRLCRICQSHEKFLESKLRRGLRYLQVEFQHQRIKIIKTLVHQVDSEEELWRNILVHLWPLDILAWLYGLGIDRVFINHHQRLYHSHMLSSIKPSCHHQNWTMTCLTLITSWLNLETHSSHHSSMVRDYPKKHKHKSNNHQTQIYLTYNLRKTN